MLLSHLPPAMLLAASSDYAEELAQHCEAAEHGGEAAGDGSVRSARSQVVRSAAACASALALRRARTATMYARRLLAARLVALLSHVAPVHAQLRAVHALRRCVSELVCTALTMEQDGEEMPPALVRVRLRLRSVAAF